MPKEEKPTKPTNPPLVTNIFVALAAINRDIVAVTKDNKNEAQNFQFRGIDDFYNVLHDIFAAHGVVTVPEVLEMHFEVKGKNAKGNDIHSARVRTKYNFIATDGSKVESVGVGEAYDFGDKALNKAQSNAHKYVLAQTFLIPTLLPDADSYTYAPTVDPTRDPFAGKTLKALEALRDEQLKAGMKPNEMSELLGRISELRAEEQDATATLGAKGATAAPTTAPDKAPDKPAAPAAAPKGADKPAAAPKPEKPKAEKPVAPPKNTQPPVVADTPPGAADDNDFGGADESADALGAPPVNEEQAKLNAACEFVIVPEILKHADYAGRKLGALSRKEVTTLVEKWYGKFKADIDANPAKSTLRDALFIVKAQWDKTPVSPNE